MTGVSLDIEIKDQGVRALLEKIQQRLGHMLPAMKIIGETVRTSVVRNFEVGGRPTKWKPLSPVTLALRQGDKILRRQGFAGGLMGSIHSRPENDQVRIGTNKVYAAVHQFGAKKGSFGMFTVNVKEHMRRLKTGRQYHVKAHTRRVKLPWGDIPARPFLMVQESDWAEIQAELTDYLLKL